MENWEAPGEIWAQPTLMQSEHRYCNISHTHTLTLTELQYTHNKQVHARRNKSTACAHTHTRAHIRLSHPKGIHNYLTNRKKKEWGEKKKHCRTHKRLQRSWLSLVFQTQPEALDSEYVHFELQRISIHQSSLSLHSLPWGREESLTIL